MKLKYSTNNPLAIKVNRFVKLTIQRCLNEDLRKRGDITTRATIPIEKNGKAIIIAKSDGIIAGQLVSACVFHTINAKIAYKALVEDGTFVGKGTTIAEITGSLSAILTAERTALNIMGRCCGVATLTNSYVKEVEGTNVKITDTRKTNPTFRYFDKASVCCGGGVNHRFGLFDQFLIKENHIKAAGGIMQAINNCKEFNEKWGKFKITVEVRDINEYREALACNPDRILLDNMPHELIRNCVELRGVSKVELEASGGITLDNVRDYAETGVDFISVGALTHSAKVLDLSLLVV